jgi:ribulose 1,5-bisphosphate carboxylase large subunit-like protein
MIEKKDRWAAGVTPYAEMGYYNPDYEPKDSDILAAFRVTRSMLERQDYRLSPAAEQAFREYLERRMRMPRFAHGRSTRNAFDRARLRQPAASSTATSHRGTTS